MNRTTSIQKVALAPGWSLWQAALVASIMGVVSQTSAAELEVAVPQRTESVDFETEVLPILSKSCLACHSSTKPESDLILETPQSILKGGLSGPGLIPGNPEESYILQVARHREEPVMPPEGNAANAKNLTPEQLGLLHLWIQQGATGEVTGTSKMIQWEPLAAGVHPIYSVAITPDGRDVAAGRANQISVYNVPGNRRVSRLIDHELNSVAGFENQPRAHQDMVESLAISPSGELLASGSFREVKFWQRPTQWKRHELKTVGQSPIDFAFSADGQWVASLDKNGILQVVSFSNPEQTIRIDLSGQSIQFLALNADGSMVVTGDALGSVQLYQLATQQLVRKATFPVGVSSVLVSESLQQIVAGCVDGTIRQFPIAASGGENVVEVDPAEIKVFAGNGRPILRMISGDPLGATMLVALSNGVVQHVELGTGNLLKEFNHGSSVSVLAVSNDAKQLATGSDDGSAKLWNLATGELQKELTRHAQLEAEIAALKLRAAVDQRNVGAILNDYQRSLGKAKEEQQGVYTAALDLSKAEVDLKVKMSAVAKPAEEKATADQAVANINVSLGEADAKLKQLELMPPAAEDAASLEQHAEAVKQQQAAIASLKEQLVAAEKEATSKQAALKKANDAVAAGQQAITAAQRALKETTESSAKADAQTTQLKEVVINTEAVLHVSQLALFRAEQTLRLKKQAVIEARGELGSVMNQFETLSARRVEGAAKGLQLAALSPEAEAATSHLIQTETKRRTALVERSRLNEDALYTRHELQIRMSSTENRIAAASRLVEESSAARDAAAMNQTELEKKVAEAADDSAKTLASTEVRNAEHRRQRAEQERLSWQQLLEEETAKKAEIAGRLAEFEEQHLKRIESAQQSFAVAHGDFESAVRRTENLAEVVADPDQLAAILVKRKQAILEALNGLESPVRSLVFSPEGNRLLLGDPQVVWEYGTTAGDPAESRPVDQSGLLAGRFVSANEMIGVSVQGVVQRVDTQPEWNLIRKIGNGLDGDILEGSVTALDFSSDGILVATGSGEASRDGEVKIWNASTGELVRSFEHIHSDQVLSVRFSPDGKHIATGGADRLVKVFDVSTGALVRTFEGHSNHVLSVSWRCDGREIVSGGADKSVKMWDFSKGEVVRNVPGFPKDVSAVQYLGSGDTFIIGTGAANQVMIRNVDGGAGTVFPGPTDFIYSVRACRDGSVVVAGGQQGVLHVWNGQGTPLATFVPEE
ncbi:c-type cytochrome domain-containing protein [Planctomicrobium sp. SH668]|uniref:c-type cytochrome domain-containing protein n=1 Tax=Planctomicrobium sp. SH668 TaxID=3448126 RepID=UPI003F5CB4C8